MLERLLIDLTNNKNIHQGDNTIKVRDLFSRKQESITKTDDKLFSMYWQVYAWCATIGFYHNRREKGIKLPHQQSFQYQMISNGSQIIAHGLILMALAKSDSEKIEEFLDIRSLLTIVSEYAEGGAKYVLELRQTPGKTDLFNHVDDYFDELLDRLKMSS
jgi:hypothetical protein